MFTGIVQKNSQTLEFEEMNMLAPIFYLAAVILSCMQVFTGVDLMLTLATFAFVGLGWVSLTKTIMRKHYNEHK